MNPFSSPYQRSAIAVALLTSFSCSALASDANSTTQPVQDGQSTETITVLGKAYRNTATKTSLEPEETPQGISVIDRQQIEQSGAKSLNQILRYAPGVVTENKGSSVTMYDQFRVRGFLVDQSYYDGLVLQYLTGWNLQPQIDPIALEQVEIFKGPTSVLYGAMPPGGMVNMIGKAPQKERETKLGVTTGSRNLKQASLDSSGQIGDSDFAYRVIALARKQDSQVQGMDEERYVFAPSLDWQLSERTLLNVNLYYQNDPAMGINSSLPASGSVYSNANGSISKSTYAGDINWSQFEREFWLAGFKINHEFNDNWTWLTNTRYMDASLHQKNTYHQCYVYAGVEYCGFDDTTGTLSRNIYSTDENSTGVTVDNQLSGRVQFGEVEHNLLFGIDYQRLSGDSTYKEYSTSNSSFYSFNIFSPNNDLLDPSTLTETYNEKTNIKVEQLGFYTQDQIRYGAWVLLAGGRWDHYSASADSNVNGNTDTDQSEFSYRVGALYEFDNGLAPFASFATSFEPTAGQDINGDAYKPEVSNQIEVGVKYQSQDMSKTASLSVYRIVKSDALVINPADYQDPELQIGELTSQGVELQGKWFITDNLDLSASYTFADMEISKDSEYDLEGTTPIYVPKHAATAWANYSLFDGALAGASFGAGARYVGEMQMDATNTQGKVPSYTVVDVSLDYDLSHLAQSLTGASVMLRGNNVFDETYYSCYDKTNCWYGAERSVELNVNYAF